MLQYGVMIGFLAGTPIESAKRKTPSGSRAKKLSALTGTTESEPSRLATVLSALDSGLLQLAGGPADHNAQITDVIIFDPADSEALAAGAIILAVGTSPETHDGAALIERAGERSAAALVFRHAGPMPERVKRLAANSGVTLLAAPPDVRWGQVHSLLRTALTIGGSQLPVEAGVAIGDLFGLADVIALTVGGPVTIEDPNWQLLAYSNLEFEIDQARRDTILGRTPPSPWRARLSWVATALRTQDEVIRFEGEPGEGFVPRLVAPVRAGDELLGSVWVAQGATPLDANSEGELARAARLAAVHLLSHRASDEIKRRTRGAFVREVLNGWAPSQSAMSTLRVSGPFIVMVFAIDQGTLSTRGSRLSRALSLVSLHCESRHPEAMTAFIDDKIWCVLPVLGSVEPDAMVNLAETIVEVVETSLGVSLVASVGPTVSGIADVPRSRQAAEQALKVLISRGDARVTHIDDVLAKAILLEIIDWASQRPNLMEGKLARLIDHDRAHRTSYQESLRAYLDARGDIPSAAKRLCVHSNTLRYRLQRLVDFSNIDFDDPDERLVIELQLRMQ